MSKLLFARLLLGAGLLTGIVSWGYTIAHVWDPTYLLMQDNNFGATHGKYHAFREALGDVASMAILMTVFFGTPRFRTQESWLICAFVMAGYYLPFWVGMPFHSSLRAPNLIAEITHITMASLSIAALLLARPLFIQHKNPA